jgi:hypothetical protein
MNPGAGVTSLAVLHEWHATVAEFQTDAGNALASLGTALDRMSNWLDEQRRHWQHEIRKCEEAVVQAQTELRNRRFTGFTGEIPDCTVQEQALRRARARLEFAEERLEAVRRWQNRLPDEINEICEPPTRRLGFFLESDLARALAVLARQLKVLEEYANTSPSKEKP